MSWFQRVSALEFRFVRTANRSFRIAASSIFLAMVASCLGTNPCAQQPARTLFRTTTLVTNLKDPMQICFLPDGRLYMIAKDGTINLYDPTSKTTTAAGKLAVSNVREDGLQSIVLDPNYATNHKVYMLFGVLTPSQGNVVASFTASTTGVIDITSRKDILTVKETVTASDEHNTGCLAFDTTGNLYIGLADNTNGLFSGTANGSSPRDPSHPNLDSQRSAANSNDLRGKILRIHPESNGTYTIPAGNLFTKTDSTLPEIFAMGIRHPFRVTVDAKKNWVYWAEPGPNAPADMPGIGPRGYDVIQYARTPGNYGYPYCRGNFFCYNEYNFTTNVSGAVYDPKNLVNNSVNNTGIKHLPPARPALVWYPYDSTGTAWPVFGKGTSNAAMLGSVYNYDPANTSPNKLPRYFDRHLFIFDFQRSLVHAVGLNDTGGVATIERFWDQTTANPVNNPIDLKIGPDGAIYFLDWSDNGAYHDNAGNGNLVKLDYTGPADPLIAPAHSASARFGESQWNILSPGSTWRPADGITHATAYAMDGRKVWDWRKSESASLPKSHPEAMRIREDVGP